MTVATIAPGLLTDRAEVSGSDDRPPTPCWADGPAFNGRVDACRRMTTSEIGLCDRHRREILG